MHLGSIYRGLDMSHQKDVTRIELPDFLAGGVLDLGQIYKEAEEAAKKKNEESRKLVDALRNFKIFKNGDYTTVKWGDNTVTIVKCQEGDKQDDLHAFEAALVRKIYGSRTKYKKTVEKNTVDVKEKKRYKEVRKNIRKSKLKPGDRVKIEIPDESKSGFSSTTLLAQNKVFTVKEVYRSGVVSFREDSYLTIHQIYLRKV